jgi:hypothetical protein
VWKGRVLSKFGEFKALIAGGGPFVVDFMTTMAERVPE